MTTPTSSVTLVEVAEQEVLNHGFEIKQIPGRGRGIVATKEFDVGEQIMFISKPFDLCVTSAALADTCYQCLRSEEFPLTGSFKYTHIEADKLRACTGCHTVKYCSKNCQALSWKAHHKFECRIFRRVHPVDVSFPNTLIHPRAAIRVLLLRKHKCIADSEWNEMLQLESHVDKYLADETTSLQLREQSESLHRLLQCGESIETIRHLLCAYSNNNMCVSYSTGIPVATALYPLPSLINHSCDPNVVVRTDMSTHYTEISSPNPILGSMSVLAGRKIAKGEEIFITYIANYQSRTTRQQRLQLGYFFTCSCNLCSMPDPIVSGNPTRAAAIALANEVVSTYREDPTERMTSVPSTNSVLKDKVRTVLHCKKTMVGIVELALTALARAKYPLDVAPSWVMRMLAVIARDLAMPANDTTRLEAQTAHLLILVYRINDKEATGQRMSYTERVTFQWQLFCDLSCLFYNEASSVRKLSLEQVGSLRCFVLEDMAQALLTKEQRGIGPARDAKEKQSSPMQGLMEMMVLEHHQRMRAQFELSTAYMFGRPGSDWDMWIRGMIRFLTDDTLTREHTLGGHISDNKRSSKPAGENHTGTAGLEKSISDLLNELELLALIEEALP